MQEAEVVLNVLRERGRKGLPLTQLYRQMFNKELDLLAYGNIYSNQGAMTPGASAGRAAEEGTATRGPGAGPAPDEADAHAPLHRPDGPRLPPPPLCEVRG